MNQILKRRVYQQGTRKMVRYLAELTEMSPDETEMFLMFHERKDDQYVMDTLGMSKDSFKLIEESMSTKLLLGILQCINYCEDNMPAK